jgi:hypothetical protein
MPNRVRSASNRVRYQPPLMDEGAQRWLVKYCYKNHWRVRQSHEVDDLIQDGQLMYYVVRDRYPIAKDPPHIMRLFQVTFINHVHDIAKKHSRMAAIVDYSLDLHASDPLNSSVKIPKLAKQIDYDFGHSYTIPNSAPWYIHAFLRLLCTEEGRLGLRARYRIRLSGVREETHARL